MSVFKMFDMFCPQTQMKQLKQWLPLRLFVCYLLFVVCCFASSSRIIYLYGDVTIELPLKGVKLRPMFDTFLYRATHAVTRDLANCGLIGKIAQCISLLRQARGTQDLF